MQCIIRTYLQLVTTLGRLDERREQVVRHQRVAGLARGRREVGEGHAHPRVVPRVDRAVSHPLSLVDAGQRLIVRVPGGEQRQRAARGQQRA